MIEPTRAAAGSGLTVLDGNWMKAPGCPGPISTKTGSRHEKLALLMGIDAELIDGMGLGELMAIGEIEGVGDEPRA
jgi:hypothetical protein